MDQQRRRCDETKESRFVSCGRPSVESLLDGRPRAAFGTIEGFEAVHLSNTLSQRYLESLMYDDYKYLCIDRMMSYV